LFSSTPAHLACSPTRSEALKFWRLQSALPLSPERHPDNRSCHLPPQGVTFLFRMRH
jgi:hypothetical protein